MHRVTSRTARGYLSPSLKTKETGTRANYYRGGGSKNATEPALCCRAAQAGTGSHRPAAQSDGEAGVSHLQSGFTISVLCLPVSTVEPLLQVALSSSSTFQRVVSRGLAGNSCWRPAHRSRRAPIGLCKQAGTTIGLVGLKAREGAKRGLDWTRWEYLPARLIRRYAGKFRCFVELCVS